ncbi:MAG: hypothetical protein U9R64_15035, partial [Pseudomonadota bacterium]|nr:hypothetical protein [Pseudomonadota bacterium]
MNLQNRKKFRSTLLKYFLFFFALFLLVESYNIAIVVIQHFIDESKGLGQEILTTSPLETISLFISISLMIFVTLVAMGGVIFVYFYVQDALIDVREKIAVNQLGWFFTLFGVGSFVGYIITKDV